MKEYPKIPSCADFIGRPCISFEKIDGSSLRTEFSKKRGWYKWGTRHRLFDKTDPDYGCAIDIFNNKYSEKLEKKLRDNFPRLEGAIAFLEFFGPHSFAGLHAPETLNVPNNDPKDLMLFDVNVLKKGFISAIDFRSMFEDIEIPEVIYEGILDEEFVKKVREKQFPVEEGVVCKGSIDSSNPHSQWRCKIKTWDYLKKIQKYFGTSWSNHWE